MRTEKIVVLDPTSKGKPQKDQVPKRAIPLEGKVMGIVWNGKLGGDVLLDRLAERLVERFHLSQVLKLHGKADVSFSLTESEINEFGGRCGFVLLGVGD